MNEVLVRATLSNLVPVRFILKKSQLLVLLNLAMRHSILERLTPVKTHSRHYSSTSPRSQAVAVAAVWSDQTLIHSQKSLSYVFLQLSERKQIMQIQKKVGVMVRTNISYALQRKRSGSKMGLKVTFRCSILTPSRTAWHV